MRVNVGEDLAVAIGDQTARLRPGEAFQLAEKLIRTATRAIVQDEADRAVVSATLRDASGSR